MIKALPASKRIHSHLQPHQSHSFETCMTVKTGRFWCFEMTFGCRCSSCSSSNSTAQTCTSTEWGMAWNSPPHVSVSRWLKSVSGLFSCSAKWTHWWPTWLCHSCHLQEAGGSRVGSTCFSFTAPDSTLWTLSNKNVSCEVVTCRRPFVHTRLLQFFRGLYDNP